MEQWVRLGLDRGSPVVHKWFGSVDEHRTETDWLLRAHRHPVVAVVHTDPAERRLTTAFVGPATLASAAAGGASPTVLAAPLADLARTIGRLHLDGLVHGNLAADHVLLGPRPVLCSPVMPSTGHDDHTTADRDGDLAALADMLRWLTEVWRAAGGRPHEIEPWLDLAEASADGVGPFRLARRLDGLAQRRSVRPWTRAGDRRIRWVRSAA